MAGRCALVRLVRLFVYVCLSVSVCFFDGVIASVIVMLIDGPLSLPLSLLTPFCYTHRAIGNTTAAVIASCSVMRGDCLPVSVHTSFLHCILMPDSAPTTSPPDALVYSSMQLFLSSFGFAFLSHLIQFLLSCLSLSLQVTVSERQAV